MGRVHGSLQLTLPKQIMARSNGSCKFETAAKRISDLDDFGRKQIEGCSYVPSVTYPLGQLMSNKVVSHSPKWLEGIEKTSGAHANVTFTLPMGSSGGITNGLDITITIGRVKSGQLVERVVRQLSLSGAEMEKMRLA